MGEETGEGRGRVGQVTCDGGLVVRKITMVKHPRRQMGPGDQQRAIRTVRGTQGSCTSFC
jgi:hypothetical protein